MDSTSLTTASVANFFSVLGDIFSHIVVDGSALAETFTIACNWRLMRFEEACGSDQGGTRDWPCHSLAVSGAAVPVAQ